MCCGPMRYSRWAFTSSTLLLAPSKYVIERIERALTYLEFSCKEFFVQVFWTMFGHIDHSIDEPSPDMTPFDSRFQNMSRPL